MSVSVLKTHLSALVLALVVCSCGVVNRHQAQYRDKKFYTDAMHIVATVCENTSDAVTVNYHCNNDSSYVLYTKASDKSFKNAVRIDPDCRLWSTKGIENTSETSTFFTHERYVCTAGISGLDPDTKYLYKVVAGNHIEYGPYTFSTSGRAGKWNFVAFTDFQHRKNPLTHKLIADMKDLCNPPLVICSGDMVDVGGKEDEWNWLLNGKDLDGEEFKDFVFAASPGDHEYWADDTGGKYPQYTAPHTYNNIFRFPSNGDPQSRNSSYFFRWNNALFVSLDMNNSNVASGARFDSQARWFEKTLDSLSGTYKYLIVFMHKSIYGSSIVDGVVAKKLRPQWAPLFSKYDVDLVLSGHDHIYSRTYQLYDGKPTSDGMGTYYLDMGSSGDKRRSVDASLSEQDGIHQKVIDLKTLGLSFACNVEVTSRNMKVTVYNQNKEIVDSFTIKAKKR
ncbi:MAG: metallophosphoesterase family protein [Bacteroidales bacterium]|nr:metallophosphoesterase family protein [Bacteroidales bacterium]